MLTGLALGLAIAACGGDSDERPTPHATGPVSDYRGLVDSLRAAGIEVEDAGETAPPFLTIPARVARADGDLVQVYHYPDSAAATADARAISPDGFTVGGGRIAWLGPPSFYRRGPLLVLHIGDAERVRRALNAIFGSPFAGPRVATRSTRP